jgi:hypothetical protein
MRVGGGTKIRIDGMIQKEVSGIFDIIYTINNQRRGFRIQLTYIGR